MQTVKVEQDEPYVGPRPFKTKEKNLFFGRKREIEELVSLITAHPIVLFYAQSGAGKTSLLNAGLITKLKDEEEFDVLRPMRVQGHLPPNFKIDKKKNIYMLNALMSGADENTNSSKLSSVTLADFLKERPGRHNKYGEPTLRVVIFDQFEELFTAYPNRWKDRQDFFEQVRDALEGNPKKDIEGDPLLRVVFSMREDYIAELDPYASILPECLRTRFRLEQMKEKSALEAVVGPLEKRNASFAPRVANQLVKNLLKIPSRNNGDSQKYGQYVEPVQLQIVCQSLWEALNDGETVITPQHLEDYGDLSQVLSDFYEKGVREVAKETAQNESDLRQRESDLRTWVENTFITSEGNRAPITRGDEMTSGQPSLIVDLLAAKKLLKEEWRGTGTRWYELAHDRFIEPIRKSNEKWLNEQNRTEQMRLRLEAKAKRWRQGVGELLEDEELFEARRLVRSPAIKTSKDLNDLVNASKATAQQKRFRMYKWGFAGLVVLLLFMSGLAFFAFHQRGEAYRARVEAEDARTEAIKRSEAAQRSEEETRKQRQYAIENYDKEQFVKKELEKKKADAEQQKVLAEQQRQLAEQEKHKAQSALVEVQHAREYAESQQQQAEKDAKSIQYQKYLIEGLNKRANSRLLAITAGSYLDDDPELSVLLAQKASNEFGHTRAAEEVIRAGLSSLSNGSHVLRAHDGRVNFVELSPDGTRVVTAGDDKTARLWNWGNKQSLTLSGHTRAVVRASFSADGERIVTASLDGTARVWDGHTGALLTELKGHTDGVTRAVWSPDSKYIATGSEDATVRIWDAETGEVLKILKGHLKAVHDLAWSPDGNHIATEGFDNTGRIWDLTKAPKEKGAMWEATGIDSSGRTKLLAGLTGLAPAIEFSPDGKLLVTESGAGRATVWNVDTGQIVFPIGGNLPDNPSQEPRATITSVAFSPNNKLVVVADSDGTARVWAVETGGRLVSELRGHTRSIYVAEFSPDSRLVVTASADNTARVWNAATGQSMLILSGHSGGVKSVDFSPSNPDIIVTGGDDGTARVWDTTCGQSLLPVLGQAAPVSSAAFSPKFDPTANANAGANTNVVTTSYDGTMRLWDARTGINRTPPQGYAHYARISYAAFSADGKFVVTTSFDKTAKVWKVEKDRLTMRSQLTGHTDRVVKAAFSPDSKFVVTTSLDGTARVWVAETGAFVQTLEEHKDGATVYSADYSPDGNSIITTSNARIVRIWDAHTFKLKDELNTDHEKDVYSARFSPKGDLIVTASADGTARVWDAATLKKVAELRGHTDEVNSAMFSPNGQFIVTASDDKTARVWDTTTWRVVNVLRGQKGKVFTAAFSPDNKYIVTASDDGTAHIYPPEMFAVPMKELLELIPLRILQRNLAQEEWEKYKYETLTEQ
ncbi:MAG: hypothetical protein WBP93_13710 [Pyrinomonadaceae bacterium]